MPDPIINTDSWGCGWLTWVIGDNGPEGPGISVSGLMDFGSLGGTEWYIAQSFADAFTLWNDFPATNTDPVIDLQVIQPGVIHGDLWTNPPSQVHFILGGAPYHGTPDYVPGMSVDISEWWTADFSCLENPCDPNALAESSRCFRCVPRGAIPQLWIYLLCQWANAR